MTKRKHEEPTDPACWRPGKYEETEGATGCDGKAGRSAGHERGREAVFQEKQAEGRCRRARELFSQDIFDCGFGLVSIAMAGFIIVDASTNDPKVK
ncbi:hypothetical protein [Rhizobium sp. AB2/73]|uniref:hypothetical protein n=1 Tax=Rhizobium sp. AB2/73 TaxID=2795216 RepID=UPI000DE12BFC|nr:hypothetical protein [Rhizobium sp. AB2/73]QYA16398.1 hypothetical protein J5284_26055 [Rhizobium sp. AB2/73]UEQ84941.1 hypothetical protein I8E17_27385 [Rhizobium sp. AB2/73]